MRGPGKAKAGWRAGCSQDADVWGQGSDGKHTATSAEALMRLGVGLALQGCDALHLLTDAPTPGIVEAADCIEAAAMHLAQVKQAQDATSVRGGAA